jgi:hypothetical protein
MSPTLPLGEIGLSIAVLEGPGVDSMTVTSISKHAELLLWFKN